MYKATRPDGRSFQGGELEWKVGETTTHPTSTKMIPDDAATYLSASTEKAECTGFSWPCRLFEVEPLPEGSFRYYNAETGERAKLTPEGRPDGTETIRVVDLGRVLDGLGYPHKRAALAFRVVRELDAFEALGPNGEAVAHLTERIAACTVEEIKKLEAALEAAWGAALAVLVKD